MEGAAGREQRGEGNGGDRPGQGHHLQALQESRASKGELLGAAPGEEEGWGSPQVWFAHAAVTTPEAHFSTERFARGGIGQAGVTVEPFRAWIDEWRLEGPDMNSLSVQAASPDFAFDMDLLATGPLVFHGENGFSQKSAEGQASYYYSQPFYKISGTLNLPE